MGSLPELNAIIAVFSTGPVGVGDGLGATNKTVPSTGLPLAFRWRSTVVPLTVPQPFIVLSLPFTAFPRAFTACQVVMATCDAAGRLLQPDKPLTAIDATFSNAAQVGSVLLPSFTALSLPVHCPFVAFSNSAKVGSNLHCLSRRSPPFLRLSPPNHRLSLSHGKIQTFVLLKILSPSLLMHLLKVEGGAAE